MKTIKLLLATAAMGLLTFTTSAQSWVTNGLVAYYPFNGNANDASGNGHNASTNGGATLTADRFGNTNSAYHFQNAFLNYTNIPVNLAGPYSFSIWMKLDGYDYGMAIGELNDPNYDCNANPQIYEANQTVTYAHCGYGVGSGSSIALLFSDAGSLTNAWHQLFVSVAAGGQTMLFRDGVLVTNTPESLWPTTANIELTLGCAGNLQRGPSRSSSRVSLDDVRIYNRALTQQEVTDLYAYESDQPLPSVSTVVKTIEVTMHVVPGKPYQLQASLDLTIWKNVGNPFVASTSTIVQDFDATEVGQFFRIQQLSANHHSSK